MDKGEWIVVRVEIAESAGQARIFFHTIVFEKSIKGGMVLNVSVRSGDLENRPVSIYRKEIQADRLESIEWISPVLKEMPEIEKIFPESEPETETVCVGNENFVCKIYPGRSDDYPGLKFWISDRAPFGGMVRISCTGDDGEEYTVYEIVNMGKSGELLPGEDKKMESVDYCPHADMQQLNEKQFESYLITAMALDEDDEKDLEGVILDTNLKICVSFDQLLSDLKDVTVIFAGEEHDSKRCHNMQLDIIRGLNDRKQPVAIGFEMFYRTEEIQRGLDSFVNGTMDEDTFRKEIYSYCWTEDWYDLYRDIFIYARDHRIRMVGLNCPEHLMDKFKNNPEELSHIERISFADEIDYTDEKHREITLWNFSGMAENGMDIGFLYPGQCIWEGTMSDSIVRYLVDNPGFSMVVCVGALHAAYRVTMPGRCKKRAESAGMEFTCKVLFPDVADNFSDSSYDDFMLMDIADYIYFIPESEEELSWMDGYNLFNDGKVDEAEYSLENDHSYEAGKILKRINKYKKAELFAKNGKYRKARRTLRKIPDAYEEAVDILLKKIDMAEKTGEWTD